MSLELLLEKNKRWSDSVKEREPDFFTELAKQQSPAYLWIGCSDSRVPANEIMGLDPGEVFVHRNVANLAVPAGAKTVNKAADAADTGLAVMPICAAVTLILKALSGRILFFIATSAMIGRME